MKRPILFAQKIDRRRFKAASTYRVISKEVENRVFRHSRIFRHTCINNSYWQRSGIIRVLDVIFLLLAVIWSELHENPRRKGSVTKEVHRKKVQKKYIEQFVWEASLFWLHTLFLVSFFVAFFVYSLPFVYLEILKYGF